MPNVQEALRQNEFNNLVSTEIMDAYIRRLIGKRATEISNIEELESLNFFPMAYISNLNDEEKDTLLTRFKNCAEKKDYRDFIQIIEANVPRTSNRSVNGFIKEYEDFAQLAGKSKIGNLSHSDFMDALKSGGSFIIRLRDRLRRIQNFRSMASDRSDGFSGSQLTRILSGIYYVNDEFVGKADDFVRFMEVRGLFTNRNEVARHYNIEAMNNMGIDTGSIQNLINSEEYRDVAYNTKTNFNDYDIRDVEKISSLDEKITSIVALPYIRNLLNLPEGHMVSSIGEDGIRRNEYVNNFKNINNLNRVELNVLEELLKRNDDDNMQTIQTRLRNYSKIVNDVVDRVYDAHGKDIVRVNTEVNLEAEKANMKGLLANMLARDGAFAKSSEQDFLETAVGICVNNYQNLYHFIPEQSKTSMRIKEAGRDGKALEIARCYVTLNNKTYSIDVTGFEKDKNNNIVFKDDAQLNEIKGKLTSLYGVSFENVKKEDFKLGYNPVAEALMNILEGGREQDSNKQVANEVASEAETSQDNVEVSASENVQQASIPMGNSIFVGSEIYMKALIEARKKVKQYILEGKVEFVSKEPANSEANVVESSLNNNESESETNEEKNTENIVEPNEIDEKLFHDQIKKRLENQSENQEKEPDVEAQKKLGEASRSELTGLNLEDFNNLIKPNIEVKSENQEEEVQKVEEDVLVDEESIEESPETEQTEVKDEDKSIGDAFTDWYNQEKEKEIQKNLKAFATIDSQSSSKRDNNLADKPVEQKDIKQECDVEQKTSDKIPPKKSNARKINPTVKNKTERVTSQKQGLYYTDESGREIPVKIVEGGRIVVDTTRKYMGANHVFYFVNRKNERKFNKVFNEIKETNNINEYGATNQNTDLDRPREEEEELIK